MKNRISAGDDVDGSVGIKCQIDISGEFTEGPFAAAGSDRLNGILRWCLGAVMPGFSISSGRLRRLVRGETAARENVKRRRGGVGDSQRGGEGNPPAGNRGGDTHAGLTETPCDARGRGMRRVRVDTHGGGNAENARAARRTA